MKIKDELNKIDINNCPYYYFDDIITDRDIYPIDILLYKESYEAYENILIYDISYKTSTASKPWCVKFKKID